MNFKTLIILSLVFLNLIPITVTAQCKLTISEVTNGRGDYLFKHSIVIQDGDSLSDQSVNLSYKEHDVFFTILLEQDSTNSCKGFDYKLEGYSSQWLHSESDQTVLSFSNLKGGEYTFCIKYKATNGYTLFRLPVTIDTPFWKQAWFYLFVLAVVIVSGVFIYLSRIKRMSKLKTVLEKQVANRTKDLEAKTEEIASQKEKIFEQRNMANKQNAKIAEQKEELERQRGELQRLVREQSNDLALAKKQMAEKSKEIVASESKYQLLAENSRDMIFRMKLPEDVMEYVSPAATKLTGYSPEDFYKNSGLYRKMIAKESREKFINVRRRILSGENISMFDYKIVTKEGSEKWLSQRNVVIKGRNGEIEAIEAIVFDVSEQKKDAVAMKAAMIRAEESEKLKTAFLSSMSHEIRTPMNSIVGFADLLRDESLAPEDRQQYVEQINSSSVSLLRLIDDIVDISKLEAGDLEVVKTPVDVAGILSDIVAEYKEKKDDYPSLANLDFKLKIDDAVASAIVNTDKVRLRQVLDNLISNALKYTDAGFVKVSLSLDPKSADSVCFSVEDSGRGIPVEKQMEIFDRYRNIRGNASKKVNGAGLGLAISRSLVELLGGALAVESEVGKGSSFSFVLSCEVSTQPVKSESQPQPETAIVDWHDKHILVAEDEDNNFKFMQAALKKTNVVLMRARDGQEAIELFKEKMHLIDMVLMDIQMPKMNGYEATKELMSLDPDIPVVAQTAFAMSGGKIKCFDAGCIGYISKPYKAKDLISVISKHIR